jgi:hypothetical protein
MKKPSWIEMNNGTVLAAIPFVAWFRNDKGEEVRFDFSASNPPIYHGDTNLFSRLSFESIKGRFAEWGLAVDHIIRGETTENSVKDCYVYAPGSKIPFAVVRPAVFVKG